MHLYNILYVLSCNVTDTKVSLGLPGQIAQPQNIQIMLI